MTRNLMAIAAAAAMLGCGFEPPIRQATDDWDEESRLKRKALEEGCERERREMAEAANRRVLERIRRRAEAESREADDLAKLRKGIEPTTGQPLSRQRRRALNREGFRFASGTEAQRATTENTGVVHDGPTAESGDAPA